MSFFRVAATLLAASLLATACNGHEGGADNNIPEEVQQFQKSRDLCDHFRGEEAYDKDRRQFLLEQMKTHCSGSDDKLKALRLRYATNKAVLESLKKYQDRIE
jgi:hypothetical protein